MSDERLSDEGAAPEAERLRDEGAALALAAEERRGEWSRAADSVVLELAESGRDFTADDVIERVGLPESRNAIGGLFLRWSRRGRIVRVGDALSGRVAAHRRRIGRYRGQPWRG